VRHQINEEYRRHLEGVQREKQEAERELMAQIQVLRESMRTDMLHIQESMARDRSEMERQLQEKETQLRGLQHALQDAQSQEKEQKADYEKNISEVREEYKALLSEEATKHEMERDVIARTTKHLDEECADWRQKTGVLTERVKQLDDALLLKNKEITTLHEHLDELTFELRKPAQKVSAQDDTLVLEPSKMVSEKPKPILGRIWDKLNEPVIEIGGDRIKK
jgi:chromosome segregation ATPase